MKHNLNTIVLFILTLFFSTVNAQNSSLKGKVCDERTEPMPFANIALFLASDSTVLIKGNATDLSGFFSFHDIPQGEYIIETSYIGYKTASSILHLKGSDITHNITLHPDRITLNEVIVEGNRSTHDIDKTAYTFSENQIKKVQEARDLVATLPNLYVDKSNNNLSSINGKSIMILINGIKATDEDLKLIPADKLKNVEYYDVPPIRYMNDAETVLNIRTKPLDTGWNGSLYGKYGQMFSNVSAAFSYIKGDNKFTLDLGSHFNLKRKVMNTDAGIYDYQIESDRYLYDYERKSMTWGDQYEIGLTYSNSKEKNYDFQVKAITNIANDKLNSDKLVMLSINNQEEILTGALTNRVHTVSPVLDIYFYKQFNKSNTLAIDLLGSYFNNGQQTHSSESGVSGFDDLMLIDNKKKSLIGEIVYKHHFKKATLSAGYKGHFNFLSNKLSNSLTEGNTTEEINTQKHYLFSEAGGRFNSFMYRISLGANYDSRSGKNGFNNFTFTPVILAGYTISKTSKIRISYNSSTLMPNIQQLSDARILLMNKFYQTGNKDLVNAHSQTGKITYDLNLSKFSLQAQLYIEDTKNSLFENYKYDNNCILMQTGNAEKDLRKGGSINLNFTPWEFLRIGCNMGAYQHDFQPSEEIKTYHFWSYPASLYVSAHYRKFSFDYYQKFGGTYLSGLYKSGIEKASYISLSYDCKKVSFGIQCYFPFIKDKVSSKTIPGSLVCHKSDLHMKRKDHTFAFSVSWRFHSGKKKDSVEQNIENSDNDKGLFEIK